MRGKRKRGLLSLDKEDNENKQKPPHSHKLGIAIWERRFQEACSEMCVHEEKWTGVLTTEVPKRTCPSVAGRPYESL